jgi:hypothetical protein
MLGSAIEDKPRLHWRILPLDRNIRRELCEGVIQRACTIPEPLVSRALEGGSVESGSLMFCGMTK